MAASPDRGRYHHGDLRNALAAAATALARGGGPEAVVLREVARQAGVSATAAYRHFTSRSELLADVRGRAVAALAGAMIAAVDDCAGPAGSAGTARDAAGGEACGAGARDDDAQAGEHALVRLRSAVHGYLRFAVDEPGLFSTAFSAVGRDCPGDRTADTVLDLRRTEVFAILARTLDDLVAAGRVPPQRRRHAEFALWSAMHGIAVMTLDSASRFLPVDERASAVDRAVETSIRGLIC